ncbi:MULTISPECIES: type II CAAX endopeptidase family protein [unclassified Sphingomonas]|uniref:CPBP family intramembrane glutamic endopeptidase n=1 Tax=unclassified Sphingomonas TaxID=196159 RepID=UPI0022699509|nr:MULTISPECIES: type II CAAX endopeptidase family protein [unclassified Sphingomonas]
MTAMIELGEAGVLAPGRWRWLRALGWMVVLFLACLAAMSLQAATKAVLHPPEAVLKGVAVASAVIAYLLYAGLVRWGERRVPAELALRALPRDLLLGIAIGLGMFTLVFASLRLLGAYTLAPGDWNDVGHDLRETLGTGFVEELIARLVIFRLLMRAVGIWPALAGSALLFGAGHLANPNATYVAALAIAVEAGLMLAAFYLLTGRIWMSVGVHAAWNFAQGAIFGARVSGQGGSGSLFVSAPVPGVPDVVSGGPFGPEASLSAMLVGVVVFVVVMAAARRRQAAIG